MSDIKIQKFKIHDEVRNLGKKWRQVLIMKISIFLFPRKTIIRVNDDDDELFLRNGWPTKGIKPYFQLGTQLEIFTIANLRHAASSIWTRAYSEFRLCWMKLGRAPLKIGINIRSFGFENGCAHPHYLWTKKFQDSMRTDDDKQHNVYTIGFDWFMYNKAKY